MIHIAHIVYELFYNIAFFENHLKEALKDDLYFLKLFKSCVGFTLKSQFLLRNNGFSSPIDQGTELKEFKCKFVHHHNPYLKLIPANAPYGKGFKKNKK